ncbi:MULTISPECIES: helix-turn-helix domain-containing protein [Bifidobacterium]|nr:MULTISPECIES: AraC family transcriptional regulator [Bifidobacterium]
MTTAHGKEAGNIISIRTDADGGSEHQISVGVETGTPKADEREHAGHPAAYMSPCDELVHHALAYIDRNICSPIDVASVARAVNVDRSHLSRTFHACVGMTAKAYIDAMRIERATAMLAESNLSIARVARRCGYTSADVFTRRFRAAHNTTPAQWRRGQRP